MSSSWKLNQSKTFSIQLGLDQGRALLPGSKAQEKAQVAPSQLWQGRSMYMLPLFPLLNKVFQEFRATQSGEDILIAHWWPSQLWFPHLIQYVDQPRFLPYCRDLQSHPGHILDGKSHHLHAWKLSCSTSKQQGFQMRSLHLLET